MEHGYGSGEKKTKIAILIASLAVFALVLARRCCSRAARAATACRAGEHPLRISEYMSANTAYPNADGRICDWIEIQIRPISPSTFPATAFRTT